MDKYAGWIVGAVFGLAVLGIFARVLWQVARGQWRTLWFWKAWWRWGYRAWCFSLNTLLHLDRSTLREYTSLASLVENVKRAKYREDPFRGALDYSKHPKHVQFRLDHEAAPYIGDCDDFHRYLASCMGKMLIDGRPLYADVYQAFLWFDGGGHSTCLYRAVDKSGGGVDPWFILDYKTTHGPYASIQNAMRGLAAIYSKGGSCKAWVLVDPDTLRCAALSPLGG